MDSTQQLTPSLSSVAVPPSATSPQTKPARNVAVDAYRGFVMLLMMGEVLQLARVAHAFPGNWFWGFLASQQTHVEWAGCSLHDLIQPSFSFLVGVALPYSLASRLRKQASFSKLFAHALWRSLVLIALGIFLRSIHTPITNFTFEDTLTQIGLGYPFLFLLGFRSPRVQWTAFGAILFAYWLAWAVYPLHASADWPQHFSGIAAHWNKNQNLGSAFDLWFLNLFPRVKPFVANEGGYLTLSFIPTLGTMILGLIAGQWLRKYAPQIPVRRFLVAGAMGVAAGIILHVTGICPVVKRIWTPGWTLFSGGACFLLLAGFSAVIDITQQKRWAFPLIVVGMNSMAAYLIAHLFEDFISSTYSIHLGSAAFSIFGPGLQPLLLGATVLFTEWLLLFWMYRRKLFLKI